MSIMDTGESLKQYNEIAELPRGYFVQLANQHHHPCAVELRNERNNIGYPLDAPDMHTLRYSIIYGYGLNMARSMAWQHALDAALGDVLSREVIRPNIIVSSSTMLTSVELYNLPRPNWPRLMSATIYMKRGPITLFSPARDVSIGQIVAAICG